MNENQNYFKLDENFLCIKCVIMKNFGILLSKSSYLGVYLLMAVITRIDQ